MNEYGQKLTILHFSKLDVSFKIIFFYHSSFLSYKSFIFKLFYSYHLLSAQQKNKSLYPCS